MKMSNRKNIGGLDEVDQTIPKQFILEINSEEKFTQRGRNLKFCFQFTKAPKPSFLPVPGAVPRPL